MTVYLLPVILIAAFVCALIKRVNVYDCFLDGAKESLSLAVRIFPYLAAVFVCIGLFRASGLSGIVSGWLSRPMSAVGIPPEISELVLLVPLSGNGAIAALEDIIARYGADSYIARCAATITGASETIFYVSAVYFSKCKVKRLYYAIPVSLFSSFLGMVIACALCRVM